MSQLILIPLPGIGTLALTREQLDAALFAARGLHSQASEPPSQSTPEEPRLLTAERLEQLTEVPASWWMTQARERRIPFRKIGRRVRFVLAEVLATDALKRAPMATVAGQDSIARHR